MKTALIYLVCALPLVGGCVGSGCNNDGPTEDICTTPGAASLTSLELVLPDDSGGYTSIADYDVIPFTYGGQGSPMIGVNLRMTGSVPDCMGQQADVRRFDDELLATDGFAHGTYQQDDGSFTTKGIFLVMSEEYYGLFARVIVTAGGQTAERHVYVASNEVPDAMGTGADAAVPDAAIEFDAQADDAQVLDAQVNDATVLDGAAGP